MRFEWIFVGEYDEINPHRGLPHMRDYMEDKPYEGMAKIIRYLQRGRKYAAFSKLEKDAFSGDTIPGSAIAMTDGVYAWGGSLAYYVSKYNLRLPKEFENHILEQGI